MNLIIIKALILVIKLDLGGDVNSTLKQLNENYEKVFNLPLFTLYIAPQPMSLILFVHNGYV